MFNFIEFSNAFFNDMYIDESHSIDNTIVLNDNKFNVSFIRFLQYYTFYNYHF